MIYIGLGYCVSDGTEDWHSFEIKYEAKGEVLGSDVDCFHCDPSDENSDIFIGIMLATGVPTTFGGCGFDIPTEDEVAFAKDMIEEFCEDMLDPMPQLCIMNTNFEW